MRLLGRDSAPALRLMLHDPLRVLRRRRRGTGDSGGCGRLGGRIRRFDRPGLRWGKRPVRNEGGEDARHNDPDLDQLFGVKRTSFGSLWRDVFFS